jgi:hypothetical protein
VPPACGRGIGGRLAVAAGGEYVLEAVDRRMSLEGVVFARYASFEEIVGH